MANSPRWHSLIASLAVVALSACATGPDDGGSGSAASAAKGASGAPAAAGEPGEGDAAVAEATAKTPAAAKAARPASLGIDTTRWLSARDKKLQVPAANLTTTYDNVVYQPDAVVFDVESVEAYTEHDAKTGAYRFDAAKLKNTGVQMKEGQTFMIPGLALRRIKGVKEEGGVLVVETEQGALNDVIKDGTVGFKVKLGLNPQNVIGWLEEGQVLPATPQLDPGLGDLQPAAGVLAMPMPAHSSSSFSTRYPELMAAPAPNPDAFNPEHMKWNFSKAGISYELEIDVRGEDAKVLVKATKAGGGDSEFQYWAKGTFKQVYLNAKGEYKDGEVKSLEYHQPDIIGDFEISIAAAGKGHKDKDINFTLPEAVLRYVFPVGSIPVVVEIKAKMIGRVVVPTKGSATATAKFKWSGNAGIEYKGTDVKAEGAFHSVDIKPDPFDSAAMIGQGVDAQWGVGIPRVSAAAFGTFFVPYIQPGITIGTHLKWGPLCKSGYVRFNVIAGWDFGVLGVSLAQHKEKLYEKEQRAPKGGCK